jgi:uncharacterized membrane protein
MSDEVYVPRHRFDPLGVLAAALAVVTVIGLFALRSTGELGEGYQEQLHVIGIPSASYPAEVSAVETGPCQGAPDATCQTVDFQLGAGPDAGVIVTQVFSESPFLADFTVGDDVVVGAVPDAPIEFRYQYQDRQRRSVLIWLTILFAVIVVVLGRWRGLAALAGLGASVALLLLFVLPAILDGREPVAVAVVGASAIAFIALYSAHGFSIKTTVALLGTVGALALTALLSGVVLGIAEISGFSTEEAVFLSLFDGIDIRGLVLAGTVLGAIGAIDDVTVTQSSAVWELKRANPTLGRRRLFDAGLRIGRDHIASTVNTLLLAYAGAALPLLVLFVIAGQSLGTIANSEVVAIEIIRTMVGSIGLVAAVPMTTWLASRRAAPSSP